MPGRLLTLARVIVAGALVIAVAALVYWRLSRPTAPPQPTETGNTTAAEPLPLQIGREKYVSSEACLKCHPEQHKTWKNSYHRTMTQIAGPQSVVAPFNDVHLESRGRSYDLQRRGDEFWVTMTEPQMENERQIQVPEKGRPVMPLPRKPQRVVL